MLSVCGLPLPLLLDPLQPAMPAAMPANSSRLAHAYPNRFAAGTRFRLSRKIISSKHAAIHINPTGRVGMWRGAGGGARNESVVLSVAVQDAVVEAVPFVVVHVAAVPSAADPFMNCTVPVGPAPWLVVATVAVNIMLPPEAIEVALAVTVVVVAVRFPTVSETVLEVGEAV